MIAAQICFGIAAACGGLATVALLALLGSLWRARQQRIAAEKRFAMDPVRRFRG